MDIRTALDRIALTLYHVLWTKYNKPGDEKATHMTYMLPTGPVLLTEIPEEYLEKAVNRICADIQEMGKRVDDERFIANIATQALKRSAR